MKWAVALGILLALPARASSVSGVRERYEYGQFAEVESLAQALLDSGGLDSAQLVELHLYAALAAFNLKNVPLADRHFTALLRQDPDYTLDPFLAPPPALRELEVVRANLRPTLDEMREARRQEATRKTQLEAQTQRAVSNQLNNRNLWVNFLPFGAGQFQQGRIGAGIAFAISEVLLAATSLISYFTYNGLFESRLIPVNNQPLGGTGQVQIYGIPRSRQRTADILRGLNLGSSIGLYAVYAGGVLEAMLRHREQNGRPTEAPAPGQGVSLSVGTFGAGVQLSLQF